MVIGNKNQSCFLLEERREDDTTLWVPEKNMRMVNVIMLNNSMVGKWVGKHS